jgi:hypothetical protein
MRNADAVRALDRDLQTIFGDRLQSVVCYGSSAPANTPDSTLAVVSSLTAADLRACAARVEVWHRYGLATPLLLAAGEFGRSLDAFPFEFGAILADHEVVSGASPFTGLTVDRADLRRACEVQARSHLLHLREGYMETADRSDRIAALIVRSAAPLAALLENVRRLTPAPAAEPVLARVAELAPDGTVSSDEARRLLPDYLAAVDSLVDELDRWSGA